MYYICGSRASVVVKCEQLWSLMRGFSSGGQVVASLPPRAQRDLTCSLLRCGVGETRHQFLSEVYTHIAELIAYSVQAEMDTGP